MKYLGPNDEYPLYVGDVLREIPEWVEGDALPEGFRQVIETDRPADSWEPTFEDELEPDESEIIPPNCEGVRRIVSEKFYVPVATHRLDENGEDEWYETWEAQQREIEEETITHVLHNGEWLNPAEYVAAMVEG